MPLLKIQVSHPSISENSSSTLRVEGAGIISQEIGKSLDFVMVLVEAGMSASFGEKTSPVAYLEVKNVWGVDSGGHEQACSKAQCPN